MERIQSNRMPKRKKGRQAGKQEGREEVSQGGSHQDDTAINAFVPFQIPCGKQKLEDLFLILVASVPLMVAGYLSLVILVFSLLPFWLSVPIVNTKKISSLPPFFHS